MINTRVNVLGVGISVVNMTIALNEIQGWIKNGTRKYVCIRDSHGLILCQNDNLLRRIHNSADMVTPDGMPLVWLLKIAGFGYAGRVYGPDLMGSLLKLSCEYKYKHFFYGSTDEVLNRLRQSIERRLPGAAIVGSFAPPFRKLEPDETERVVRVINESGANIVWVGLGTPKQELWMAEQRGSLRAEVLIGVGAAFDFYSGVKPQAPKLIQRSGFEWLYRLATEPRRLWRRYLKTVPLFMALIICQKLGLKSYSIDS